MMNILYFFFELKQDEKQSNLFNWFLFFLVDEKYTEIIKILNELVSQKI